MIHLITASQCIAKLNKDAGEEKYKASYFSKLVSSGKIKYHNKPGSPKKFFIYSEVVDDLRDMEDPRRDPQREANREKRVSAPSLMDAAGTYESEADLSEDEIEERRAKLRELYAEADDMGIGSHNHRDEDTTKLSVKGLNQAILEQDLRIKKAKADEADGILMPVDEVRRSVQAAARLIRDGLLGIPARLAPRLAAEQSDHACRDMLEEEIVRQLKNLSEVFRES